MPKHLKDFKNLHIGSSSRAHPYAPPRTPRTVVLGDLHTIEFDFMPVGPRRQRFLDFVAGIIKRSSGGKTVSRVYVTQNNLDPPFLRINIRFLSGDIQRVKSYLIELETLYILFFTVSTATGGEKWMRFSDVKNYQLDGVQCDDVGFGSSYTAMGAGANTLGPGLMATALADLDNPNGKREWKSAMKNMIRHIAESTRFKPIKNKIADLMGIPDNATAPFPEAMLNLINEWGSISKAFLILQDKGNSWVECLDEGIVRRTEDFLTTPETARETMGIIKHTEQSDIDGKRVD